MKPDCEWFEQNIEAFFSGNLTQEQERVAQSHLETCVTCRDQVTDIETVDPLIKRIFQFELALAQTSKRRRSTLVHAVAAVAALAMVILSVMLWIPLSNPRTAPQHAAQSATAPAAREQALIVKDTEESLNDRTKPDLPSEQSEDGGIPVRNSSRDSASRVPVAENAPAFLVTDAAGYSRTLEDYRGYVLLFGVWSPDQVQTIANLDRVYRAFSTNSHVRILGIASKRAARPNGTTFPVVYNDGSRLLGATPGELMLVDASGTIRFRASLSTDPSALLKDVRTALESQGIQ
jgi:hypothetical protein